ncbi:MAG: hypothetical protein E6R07_14710 [Nevskiaceae bacterium]|nr:MAG: hypothetical protein E6R07_14710 [Nevskiaceae bacterium]
MISRRQRANRIVLLCGLALGLAACGTGQPNPVEADAVAKQFASTPDPDPFYRAGANLPDVPGTILNSRAITFQPAGIPEPNPAWQIQYVTHDVNGNPIAAVATVVKPLIPNVYGHPVLVSFQHAYDSLGPQCSPSHSASGSTDNQTNMAESAEYLIGLQSLGWTMVVPDYEGPNNEFGASLLSGQATLDAIRAALQFAPLGLSKDTPVALWGYSGGAFASGWAATLKSTYANELNLVGTVIGGTPSDLFHVMHGAENTSNFAVVLGGLFGITRAYPETLPYGLLTAKGRQALSAMKDGCEGRTSDGSALPALQLSDLMSSADPYNTAGILATAPKINLLQSELSPTSDTYMYHEINDELVPISDTDKLAARWCQAHTPLSYYRSSAATAANSTPLGAHTAGAALGTPAAIAYLVSRFSGLPSPITPPGTARCN